MQLVEKVKSAIRDIQDYPKPGVLFKDITPLLSNPHLRDEVVNHFVDRFRDYQLDAIAAVEARGFIFGSILAHELKCKLIPVRKAGKLPYKTLRQAYALEYGTAEVEMHIDALESGMRVLIHDDLLATGGTAIAAANLVKASGATITGFSFLINLGFLQGSKLLEQEFAVKPYYLIEY